MFNIIVFLLLLAFGAMQAHADAIQDCEQDEDPKRKIEGCTSLIEEGKLTREVIAIAHMLRGNAYDDVGERARAIADYDKAVELNPQYAKALLQSRPHLWRCRPA